MIGFNPLWINTALKQGTPTYNKNYRFNPLWINTALKLTQHRKYGYDGFNPLWINTALKRGWRPRFFLISFNPLWINTALKLQKHNDESLEASIPYGLTLLSNFTYNSPSLYMLQSPMD